MDLAFIDTLIEDEDYVAEISTDLWLMDDHRWAFYVWERCCQKKGDRFALAHLDFHYDGVNDFEDDNSLNRLAMIANLDEAFDLVKEGKYVRYDSFIAPAIMRGFIAEVHFLCYQSDDDTDRGIDENVLSEHDCAQFFYDNPGELVAGIEMRPLLFDLCLDLFNKDNDKVYEGDIWSDSEIVALLDTCQPLLKAAAVVTLSMSFGYSGAEEQTRHLAKLVIPKCVSFMKLV